MRVAVVTDQYNPAALPSELPGAVRFDSTPYAGATVRETAAAQASGGLMVEVLTPARYLFSLRRPLAAWREYRQLGIVEIAGPVRERYAFWPCRGAFSRPPLDALAIPGEAHALCRLLDSGPRPDLVHAHFGFPAGCAAARAAYARGLPWIISVHESYLPAVARRSLVGAEMKRALAGAACVIVPSRFQRDRLLRFFPTIAPKVAVVPNGADDKLFRPCESARPDGPPRLTFVGNLVDVKDPRTLLAAVRLLATEKFDYELSVAGQGPLRAELEAEARSLGGRVRFLGTLTRAGVAELLRDGTDIYLLTSQTDTFPHVVSEALCSGVPVVATRCGGPEDAITPECGRLVPVGDARALAAAVREVWARRAEFSPEGIAARARERFSYATVAARLAGIYAEVPRR